MSDGWFSWLQEGVLPQIYNIYSSYTSFGIRIAFHYPPFWGPHSPWILVQGCFPHRWTPCLAMRPSVHARLEQRRAELVMSVMLCQDLTIQVTAPHHKIPQTYQAMFWDEYIPIIIALTAYIFDHSGCGLWPPNIQECGQWEAALHILTCWSLGDWQSIDVKPDHVQTCEWPMKWPGFPFQA